MSTRLLQGRRDSSSRPEATVGLPTRPPVHRLDIRQPLRYPSNTTLADVPSGLNVSHRPQINRLSVGGKVRAFKPAAQVAGFGPPNVPVPSLQGGRRLNSRRTTHFPLRNIPYRPSPNALWEWQREWAGRTPSGTRMNPEASTFAPKRLTYAQTVKASLPRRSVSEANRQGNLTRLSGEQSEGEASDHLPTDKPTKNNLTAHRGSQTAEGGAVVVVGSSSRDSVVSRRHSSLIPRIEVTMEGKSSQREPEASLDPQNQLEVSSKHRTTRANLNLYDWNDEYCSPHPMSFHNPLLGPYIPPHSPMPGYEHLDPRYKYPSPWLQPTPTPWDPAIASAWEHFHRSQSAQAYYGPFQPPPIPAHDMQQAYMPHQPMPPFAPFPGYPNQPLHETTDREAQAESLSPPPAPTKKVPSRGKLHQMVREAQRAKRHREHSQARAEAWRAQNEDGRPPQPVFREREYSQTTPALSHAHPRIEPRQGQSPSGFSPTTSLERQTLLPTVGSEQLGRTQYRLISVKPTTPRPNRQKPNVDNVRQPSLESNDSALLFGEDKVDPRDIAHLASQTTGDTSKPATVKADGPPPNAPTGPASLRRFASLQHQRSSLVQKPAEQSQGLWSQSKRWVSQETKERAAFQKLMHTLRYMGADKSPFLPQTPSELTRFKIAQADRKSKKMSEQLTRMEERRYRRRKAQQEGLNESTPEILGGKKVSHNLSPVFAQDSCFNEEPPREELKVDWPCRAELKEEGDKRAARYGRYFPLPRLNIVATRILEDETNPYNEDGSISWEKKAVKHMSRFIRPVTSELEDLEESVQIDMHELHQPLEDLLKEIDAYD